MAKGDIVAEEGDEPPLTANPITNATPRSKAKQPMKARGMVAATQSKGKTANSPPQNLRNPLTELFGDRMKSRRPK